MVGDATAVAGATNEITLLIVVPVGRPIARLAGVGHKVSGTTTRQHDGSEDKSTSSSSGMYPCCVGFCRCNGLAIQTETVFFWIHIFTVEPFL